MSALACAVPCALLQEPDEQGQPPPVHPEVLVTAKRYSDTAFDTPRAVSVVTEEELHRRNQAVALDALRYEIGIWVEHRTASTADPVIRGLSGGNILALVDGNTLSTFWGEGGFAGDDLYGKVDAYSLQGIEVVRGPGSVLYGSNALGGVVNFITRRPPLEFTGSGTAWGGELRSALGTNNHLRRGRADLWGASPWMRWRLGATLASMDDYHGGNGVGLLSATNGREGNYDWNSEFRLSDTETLLLDVQRVHRNPVYRHYRPAQRNTNDRLGIQAAFRSEQETPLWDELLFRVYHQDKEDWRFFANGDRGVARWDTWTSDLQAQSVLGDHYLTWGLAFHLDRGESPDDEQFTILPAGGGPMQKAAPDSAWWNLGAFLQDEWALGSAWSLLGAIRFDHFIFRSTPDIFYSPPAGSPPALDDLRSTEDALTGGLALTRYLGPALNAYASWFRGFRQFAPNFGLRQLGFGVLAPNGLLDPVTADTWELGSKWEEDGIYGEAALYYTDFDHFQNIVAGSFRGQPFFDLDANGTLDPDERVYVTSANGSAYVKGIELALSARLDRLFSGGWARDWWVNGGFMWNIGQDLTNNVPLRHTHPARGLAGVLWEPQWSDRHLYVSLDAELVRRFTRIDPNRLLSDVGYRLDPQDASSPLLRPDGLPGYALLNLRAGMDLTENAQLTLAVENLLDKNYRAAHSRADGMGINLLLGLSVRF